VHSQKEKLVDLPPLIDHFQYFEPYDTADPGREAQGDVVRVQCRELEQRLQCRDIEHCAQKDRAADEHIEQGLVPGLKYRSERMGP